MIAGFIDSPDQINDMAGRLRMTNETHRFVLLSTVHQLQRWLLIPLLLFRGKAEEKGAICGREDGDRIG